ncbi:MAG: pyridoxal-phosphate dependent enzyme [Pseudomonadota bacterium]
MEIIDNPWRGRGIEGLGPMPSIEAEAVAQLLAYCPAHLPTPLLSRPGLAAQTGLGQLRLKDERARMGLGSFKALGAAYAIARDAAAAVSDPAAAAPEDWAQALAGRAYVTASAGNHGLSVAAGARVFGAQATVHVAGSVPDGFAARLRAMGARVTRSGAVYEEAMAAAEAEGQTGAAQLLSDSSWPGYTEPPFRVMEGYLQMAAEAAEALATGDTVPDLIMLQAGVGGMAAAVAAYARHRWGDEPRIVVVEPAAAPALVEGIRAGRVVDTEGPVSSMGRLDCKTASMIALAGLARDADLFATIGEKEAAAGVAALAEHEIETTPSGGAGIAALVVADDLNVFGVAPGATGLAFLSETGEAA